MIIAVIDENKDCGEKTAKCIAEYFRDGDRKEPGAIRVYTDLEDFQKNFLAGLFGALVIEPGSGERDIMDLIRQIRFQDPDVPIIFFTDSQEYVLEGYTVSAFRYILKFREGAQKLLTDALELLMKPDRDSCLEVMINGKKQCLFYQDIVYGECLQRATYLHLSSGKAVKVQNPIKEIVRTLCGDRRFAECYRDVIVNFSWVREVTRQDVFLAEGEKIPLSRRKRCSFCRKWEEYVESIQPKGTMPLLLKKDVP